MITEHDIIRLRHQHGLSKDSISSVELFHVTNGKKVFYSEPIKAWNETEFKLREVEDIIGMSCGLATVVIENTIMTVKPESLLIERY